MVSAIQPQVEEVLEGSSNVLVSKGHEPVSQKAISVLWIYRDSFISVMYSSCSSESTLAACLEEHSNFTVIAARCLSLVLLHTICIHWSCNWGVLEGVSFYLNNHRLDLQGVLICLAAMESVGPSSSIPAKHLILWGTYLPTKKFRDLLLQLSSLFGKALLVFCFFNSLVSPKLLTKANSTRERDSCFCIY